MKFDTRNPDHENRSPKLESRNPKAVIPKPDTRNSVTRGGSRAPAGFIPEAALELS